jgi:hypothetical protein
MKATAVILVGTPLHLQILDSGERCSCGNKVDFSYNYSMAEDPVIEFVTAIDKY